MSEFTPDDSTDEALPQSDRLQILSPEEYELLWGFPRFTQSDRDLFFTLTVPERRATMVITPIKEITNCTAIGLTGV